ncbi:hypothetical protein [Myxococcus stipitatus]|uniref:hypothetical protein n=1 Tax=Myxococcus stipitatus TaxID=83455 RepID=UPI0030D5BAE7
MMLGLCLGVAAPAGFIAYAGVASSRASDVGGLRDLAGLQARLRPLPVCRVEYGVRGGRYGSSSAVRVWACGAERVRRAQTKSSSPSQ